MWKLTYDLLDGDRLENERRINVVLMNGTLDEDHPPLVFVSEEVPHFTDVSEQALFFHYCIKDGN
jgi:hypothetical protein